MHGCDGYLLYLPILERTFHCLKDPLVTTSLSVDPKQQKGGRLPSGKHIYS